MPRGCAPGERRGGRSKGTPNKKSQDIRERLLAMGCDPIEGMARIAMGQSPCFECPKAKGRQKYSVGIAGLYVDIDNGVERTCRICHGTGKEPIPAKLAGEMLSQLAQYVAPKLKAIELTGAVELKIPEPIEQGPAPL
ncbi:hypothetical protein H0W26_04005 [Candidatus Dependentiae bacterium]|nr:hypothetical protein [Candidatus Dependentiae bacterium]